MRERTQSYAVLTSISRQDPWRNLSEARRNETHAIICRGEPTADSAGRIMPPIWPLIVSVIAACYISTRKRSVCLTRKAGDHLAAAAVWL